jgi:hypothetical protein
LDYLAFSFGAANTNNRYAGSYHSKKQGKHETKDKTNISKAAFLHQVDSVLAGAAER